MESILAQTFQDYEIIVINNIANLDLEEFLAQFNDPRIILVEAADKKSAAYARNEGLKKVRGDFISILDSDDFMKINHLKEAIQTLTRSGADIYYCGYCNKLADINWEHLRIPKEKISKFELLTYNPIGHSSVVMRSSLEPVYPDIPRRHDLGLWLTLYDAKANFISNKSVNIQRNLGASSLSSQKGSQIKSNWELCQKHCHNKFQALFFFIILIINHLPNFILFKIKNLGSGLYKNNLNDW